MFPPLEELVGWIFKITIAGFVSYMWWGKKEDKKLLDSHTEDIVRLKSQAVTEDKVREIVTEVTASAISPMCEAMSEIKRLVQDNTTIAKQLQIKLAMQEGYQQALKEMKDD